MSGRRQELALWSICSVSVCPTCPEHGLSSHWVNLHNPAAFWNGFASCSDKCDLLRSIFSLCCIKAAQVKNIHLGVIIANLRYESLPNTISNLLVDLIGWSKKYMQNIAYELPLWCIIFTLNVSYSGEGVSRFLWWHQISFFLRLWLVWWPNWHHLVCNSWPQAIFF